MSRFFVTPDSPEGWREGLARESHWRVGYSAHSLAYTWHPADGFPPAVAAVLTGSPLGPLELVTGIPEYKVALPGGDTASQTDLFVLARTADGARVAMAVEGKAEEAFGDATVAAWRCEGSDGKKVRLKHLLAVLGLVDDDRIALLRYQLFHRTAAAVMEAERLHAPIAVMLVHSFSPTSRWYREFSEFAELLGVEGDDARQKLAHAGKHRGRDLYLSWIADAHPKVAT